MHTKLKPNLSSITSPPLSSHLKFRSCNLSGKRIIFKISLFLLALLPASSKAQLVWENPHQEIYNFLSRQAQKGRIVFDDVIKPLSRKEISRQLDSLVLISAELTLKEKKELSFYQKEYSEFNDGLKDSTGIFRKDQYKRWRSLSVSKDDFLLRADPVLSFETIQGTGQNIFRRSNGLSFWGHAGKHIGFQFYFRDISENGTGIDSLKNFSPEPGIVRAGDLLNKESVNYSDIRGYISYGWKNGSLSFGKDQLIWGYSKSGNIILSDKAPSYPLIRLRYTPLNWLSFEYTHAWLQSSIVDSSRSYPKGNSVYGSEREFYIPKFLATHSLSFFPIKGLTLSIGESMIYSDRIDVGYLIPVMFFKAYDHYSSRYNINSGANGQFFFQVNSRNHIPNTQLYASLFIDEIRLGEAFNTEKSRNQLGFTLGGTITDVFVQYLTLGMEYTRINPFVYRNLIPAQDYTSQGYPLGDWMGNNADRFTASMEYTPIPRLKTSISWQKVRKGAELSIVDQYLAEPQPDFLTNHEMNISRFNIELKYEAYNRLNIYSKLVTDNWQDIKTTHSTKRHQFQLGISYSL